MEEYNKEDFNKCCSEDESKLAYPRFSAVFLQTFCIHDSLQFVVPKDAVLSPEEYKKNMKEIREDAQKHAKDEAEKNVNLKAQLRIIRMRLRIRRAQGTSLRMI